MDIGPVDLEWVADVERVMFRTHMDTGANKLVMMTWNWTRRRLGLPDITIRDLVENYAASDRADLARYWASNMPPTRFIREKSEHLAMLEDWLSRDDVGLRAGIAEERAAMEAIKQSYSRRVP